MKVKLIGVVMGVAVWMGTASASAEDAAVASVKTRLVGASLFNEIEDLDNVAVNFITSRTGT